MSAALYRTEPYMREAESSVARLTEDGVVPAESLFYPTGGGQQGDTGRIEWDSGAAEVVATRKDGTEAVLVLAEGAARPPAGAAIRQVLDWDARHRMMRLHTCLHLLSVVIPLPVTGGQITPAKARLDFDMPEAPEDKAALEARLNALIAADHPVTETWISDAELDADPGLVKTMSVQPPRGEGRVRLVRIGPQDAPVDLQPCGGTHVRATAEIGRVILGKIEKKGRQNRRVTVTLAE